jgi:hypothetical protein
MWGKARLGRFSKTFFTGILVKVNLDFKKGPLLHIILLNIGETSSSL